MLTRVKTIAAAFVMTGFLAGAVAPTFLASDAAAQTTQKAEKKAPAKKQVAKKKTPAKKQTAKKPAQKTKKAA